MSDTVLALAITALLLGGLAAWVPLLHMAEKLTKRSARVVAQELPQSRERMEQPDARYERKIAQ